MDLVIIGAGGHGRDCHQVLDDLHADGSAQDLNLIGYVDDNPALHGAEVQGQPVLGDIDWLQGRNVAGVMGIGYPRPRYAVQQRAAQLGMTQWPSLIHPLAYVASRATLGEGVFIAPFAFVGPNTSIGFQSIVNVAAAVAHDVTVGTHCLIAARAAVAGHSQIGNGVLIGCGANVAPEIRVGEWSRVGMGSAVLADVPPYVLAVGVPAKVKHAHSILQSAD